MHKYWFLLCLGYVVKVSVRGVHPFRHKLGGIRWVWSYWFKPVCLNETAEMCCHPALQVILKSTAMSHEGWSLNKMPQ